MADPTAPTKRCNTCGEIKPLDEFNRSASNRDRRRHDCRECQRAKDREFGAQYRAQNRDRLRQRHREWARAKYHALDEASLKEHLAKRVRERRKVKTILLDHYGRACACCGSTKRLSIDHVNGDGGSHRAEIGAASSDQMYRWIIDNGFPPDFQVLCMPCNRSKNRGTRCVLDHGTAQLELPL